MPNLFGTGLQYGQRNTITPSGIEHGVDIEVPSGTQLYSPKYGTIIYAKPNPTTGGTVGLNTDGQTYWFGHLKDFNVSEGDTVNAGDALGITGGGAHDRWRGNATGAHMWFAVTRGQEILTDFIDPTTYRDDIAMFKGGGSSAVNAALLPPFSSSTQQTYKPVAQQGIGPFKFPLVSYGKVIGGVIILLIALVIIVAAMGLRSGTAGSAVESAPVVGPAVKGIKQRRATRTRQTIRREQAESTRQVRANRPRGNVIDVDAQDKAARQQRINDWFKENAS